MVLVVSFDVDVPEGEEYSLNDEQKQLLRKFEEASDSPLGGVDWFTTSERTYDKMLEV